MTFRSVVHVAGTLLTIVALFLSGPLGAAAQPPAPVPLSPAEGSTVVIPTFSWQASGGAATYEVEVGPQSNPNTVYWTTSTFNLSLTPAAANSFPNEPLYWRVRAVDSGSTAGAWTARINFTKHIPGPTLVSPANGGSVVVPTLEWQAVEGAAEYKVEVSASATFVPMVATYFTSNTRLTPESTLPHGTLYWRVSGVDADDHVGTASGGWSFVKAIPAPTLASPAEAATVDCPTLEWQAVEGAAYYRVELSTEPGFVPMYRTLTTYNTRITPEDTVALGTYYWRVTGLDADGHVGTPSGGHSLILSAAPAPVDSVPLLLGPANGETIAADPTFSWTRVVGAHHYFLRVSTDPGFGAIYESTPLDYNSYTPYNAAGREAYANGTYYWQVEARTSGGAAIATSESRSFTKQMAVPLTAPADGAVLHADPTFQWPWLVGVDHYFLRVSTDPGFGTTYDSTTLDYNSYTTYNAASRETYANGTYYWQVEARSSGGITIATSASRSFTKQMAVPLTAPPDGAVLDADPTFRWPWLVGVDHYFLRVSTDPDFDPVYDSTTLDYNSYTPYDAAGRPTYADGVYYWEIEARNSGGLTIATSDAWMFSIGIYHVYLPFQAK